MKFRHLDFRNSLSFFITVIIIIIISPAFDFQPCTRANDRSGDCTMQRMVPVYAGIWENELSKYQLRYSVAANEPGLTLVLVCIVYFNGKFYQRPAFSVRLNRDALHF